MNMAAQSRPNQLFAAGPKQRPETGQQVDAPSHGMGAAAPPPPMFGAPPRGMPNGTHMPPPPSAWPPARPPPPTFMQPPPMAQPSGPPPGMGPPPQQQQMGAPPMAGQPPPWMAPPGVSWHEGFSRPPWFPVCTRCVAQTHVWTCITQACPGWLAHPLASRPVHHPLERHHRASHRPAGHRRAICRRPGHPGCDPRACNSCTSCARTSTVSLLQFLSSIGPPASPAPRRLLMRQFHGLRIGYVVSVVASTTIATASHPVKPSDSTHRPRGHSALREWKTCLPPAIRVRRHLRLCLARAPATPGCFPCLARTKSGGDQLVNIRLF